MVHAQFINDADSVPFMRVYKSFKSMRAAVRRMHKNATFIGATDFKNMKVYRPSDIL